MTAYRIVAHAIDRNGVEIASNNPETLGKAYGVTYLTLSRAEAVMDDLASDLPEGYETAKYSLEEREIFSLVEGDVYDVESVAEVMSPLPEGYNICDYFTPSGEYRGEDEDGIGITI